MSDSKGVAIPTEKPRRTRTSPKGFYCDPPEDLKRQIQERCEESLRTEQNEILWIVRDWIRGGTNPNSPKPT